MEHQGDKKSIINDNDKRSFLKIIREYSILVLICIISAVLLKTFVIERADVIGSSMRPTLHNRDVVLVEKLSCILDKYKTGEIVIFNSHDENNEIYIKRVIAGSGETVEIKNNKVYVNDKKLNEGYLSKDTVTGEGDFLANNQKYTVPKGYVFVMGDNRGNSLDSRIIGPVKIKDIEGHVILRVFPLKSLRTF
ncbi:signal peptidase I [Clostridium oryzae]|uniref:Signal peptidase I n=1 Tax=Clostridium oryzae TaxID=1450648 RepID=A0A1V4IQE4_9CLOT|nr:signal peptidase I [Clostridium oryzae]OPJ62251.1 signal peptidase I T [Clostridium oryzae]